MTDDVMIDAMMYEAEMEERMNYRYKMTQRPFSMGCQPKSGLVKVVNAPEGTGRSLGYYSILTYDRQLTEDELYRYELTEVKR